MITILLVAALSCPVTTIENWTKVWNAQDQKTLDGAKIRCGQMYPSAPCVKLFRKKDATTYNVICGAENDQPDPTGTPDQDDQETDYA
jgi:hypothetical protein